MAAQTGGTGRENFCDLELGDELHLLKATDFMQATHRDRERFLMDKPKPLAVLLNDCVLRTLNNAGHLSNARFFEGLAAAGFSTFGEILGVPINQTLSALVFFEGEAHQLMADFPLRYASYARHYALRALKRWKALHTLQATVVDKVVDYQQAIRPLLSGLSMLVKASEHQANTPYWAQSSIISIGEAIGHSQMAQGRLGPDLDDLEQISSAIGKITGGISAIADQTNLLTSGLGRWNQR